MGISMSFAIVFCTANLEARLNFWMPQISWIRLFKHKIMMYRLNMFWVYCFCLLFIQIWFFLFKWLPSKTKLFFSWTPTSFHILVCQLRILHTYSLRIFALRQQTFLIYLDQALFYNICSANYLFTFYFLFIFNFIF